jgi:hypothetical protein
MPPLSDGPLPAMFDRSGPSPLDERVSNGCALTRVDAS